MRLLGPALILTFVGPGLGCSSASMSGGGGKKSAASEEKQESAGSTPGEQAADAGEQGESEHEADNSETVVLTDPKDAPEPAPSKATTFTLLENKGYAFPAKDPNGTYTWSTQTVDTKYHRDLKLNYELDLTCAFAGYAPHVGSYFKNFCNGNALRVNPPAPSKAKYTDELAKCGDSTITLKWESGHFYCGTTLSVLNIAVTGVKDPPLAKAQKVETTQNSATDFIGLAVSDPQGAPIAIHLRSKPSQGTLAWNGTKFSYTPEDCFSGSDSFQYYVTEKLHKLASEVVTVSIEVQKDSATGCH